MTRGIGSVLTWVELQDLPIGARFMFFADDLENRGPATLIEAGPGSAVIKYEDRRVTRRFKARDEEGQLIDKEITATVTGETRCALGAQVIPL